MNRSLEPPDRQSPPARPDPWRRPDPSSGLEVDVTTDGRIAVELRPYAQSRIRAATSRCRRSIHRAEVRIIRYPDPLLPQPVVARANLNVEGHLLQAHALGDDVRCTIDDLHDAVRAALAGSSVPCGDPQHRGPAARPARAEPPAVPSERPSLPALTAPVASVPGFVRYTV